MVPARINLVTLGVADVGASTAFYDALGWKRSVASTDSVAFYSLSGTVLALYRIDLLAADLGEDLTEAGSFRGTSLALNVETPAMVDNVVAAMLGAGGRLISEPRRADWGGYVGHVADPDGWAWEIAYNPGFPIGADGRIRLPEGNVPG